MIHFQVEMVHFLIKNEAVRSESVKIKQVGLVTITTYIDRCLVMYDALYIIVI